MRRTFEVKEIVNTANEVLKLSTHGPDYRHGVIDMVEHILHATGTYNGFCYLLQKDVPAGHMPGQSFIRNERDQLEASFENTDSTRRHYLTKGI